MGHVVGRVEPAYTAETYTERLTCTSVEIISLVPVGSNKVVRPLVAFGSSYPALRPCSSYTMAINAERLIELLTEQHNAINTAESCRRQIAALLTEQLQRERLERGTVGAAGERGAEPPPKRRQPSTQPDDTSDEDLLESLRIYEKNKEPIPPIHARQQSFANATKEEQSQAREHLFEHTAPQPQAIHGRPTELGTTMV